MKNLLIRFGKKPKDAVMETLQLCAVSVFVLALASYSQLFQLCLLLIPAIFTMLSYRNGVLFSLLGLFLSVFAISFVPSGMAMASLLTVFGTMGVLVGELSYRTKSMIGSIALGAMVVIANFMIIVYLQTKMSSVNYMEFLLNNYIAYIEQRQLLDWIKLSMTEIKTQLRVMMPGILISTGAIIGALNYFFAGRMVKRLDPQNKDFKSFSEFILPGSAFVALLVTFAGIYVVHWTTGYSTDILTQNLVIVYFVLFLIQGLSLIDAMLLQELTPIIRYGVIFLLALVVFTAPFLATIGALDSIFNIRRLTR